VGKTESIFNCLQSGPKTTAQVEKATGLTPKQIHNLLKYHVERGAIQRKDERWHLIDSVQQKINEAVAFLESHGYEFD
jgi:predicted transcriptional regulator